MKCWSEDVGVQLSDFQVDVCILHAIPNVRGYTEFKWKRNPDARQD